MDHRAILDTFFQKGYILVSLFPKRLTRKKFQGHKADGPVIPIKISGSRAPEETGEILRRPPITTGRWVAFFRPWSVPASRGHLKRQNKPLLLRRKIFNFTTKRSIPGKSFTQSSAKVLSAGDQASLSNVLHVISVAKFL